MTDDAVSSMTASGAADAAPAVSATVVRGLVHELRTPLQYVADSVRFLERALAAALAPAASAEPGHDDRLALYRREAPGALERVREGAQRLGALVDTLAALGRDDGDEPELADPNRIAQVALAAAHHELKYLTVELELGEVPMVPCRAGALSRHLAVELLRAAHDAARDPAPGETPRLRVTSRIDGQDVVIEVARSPGPAAAPTLRLPVDAP